MRYYLIFIISFCVWSVAWPCSAQEHDAQFIKKFQGTVTIVPYFGHRVANLEYSDDNPDNDRTYKPNISGELGLGFTWRKLGLSTKIYGFEPNKKYGKTKALDFQGYWYLSKFQITGSLQDYKGFYTRDGNGITIRPDLRMRLLRLYGEYLFNHAKFSYRSAFEYDERQMISAGTWKLGVGLYYTSLKADSTLNTNGSHPEPRSVKDYQVVMTLGYAHNFIFGGKRQWFASASMSAGVGISVINDDKKLALFPTFYPRLAVGYLDDNWAVGFSAHHHLSQASKMKSSTTTLVSGFLKVSAAYRFDPSAIFRRRK